MTRFGYVTLTCLMTMGVAASALIETPKKLIWNASASAPIGLYSIEPADLLEVTDLVAVDAPEPLARFLAERRYLPRGLPLMKRIAGLPGQQVCRLRSAITVDGIAMGAALDRDRLGRDLPVWRGCRRIADGEVFLMNRETRDSLDGRYFGPLPMRSIIGRAVPLWTDEDGSGHYEWRAPTR
ncbi:MAG: S26 family signal peptidase [Bauldia sp.]